MSILLDQRTTHLPAKLATWGISLVEEISTNEWSTVWKGQSSEHGAVIVKHQASPIPRLGEPWLAVAKFIPEYAPKLLHFDQDARLFVLQEISDAGSAPSPSRAEILNAYARAQSAFAKQDSQATNLPRYNLVALLTRVQALAINATRRDSILPGNAISLAGLGVARRLADLLARHAARLERDLQAIPDSFLTISHTDLRRDNIRRAPDGTLRFIDWDDAVLAPPGLSLHMQFSGVTRFVAALRAENTASTTPALDRDREDARHYIETLSEHGGFEAENLANILPLMAVMGVLKYVDDMRPYDLSGDETSAAVQDMVTLRVQDLEDALSLLWRRDTDHPRSNSGTGRAVDTPASTNTEVNPARPIVKATAPDAVERGAAMFKEHGALLLKAAFSPDTMTTALAEFKCREAATKADIASGGALRVGDKRHMISLPADKVFGRPDIIANDAVTSVIKQILGEDCILGSLTCVQSQPGAADQHWHQDNGPLFDTEAPLDTPAFAVTVLVPMVEMDAEIGGTQIRLGSHVPNPGKAMPGQFWHPPVELGDCYLMDCRVFHRGLANRSQRERPVLSLVYQKPWYRDHLNFHNQPALQVCKGTAEGLPDTHRHLIDWVTT